MCVQWSVTQRSTRTGSVNTATVARVFDKGDLRWVRKMLKNIPQIAYQGARLILRVPSKTHPHEPRLVEYKIEGDRFCDCEGHHWFTVKGEAATKMCRHHKMTTIRTALSGDPRGLLRTALRLVGDHSKATSVAWAHVFCQYPEHRKTLECTGCPLYPVVCNIHPIRYKRSAKPLVWKLQTAIYAGKRKESQRIIRKIMNAITKVKSK